MSIAEYQTMLFIYWMDVIIEPRITVLVSESVNIEPTSLLSLTLSNLSLILAQVNLFDNAKKKKTI